MARSPTAKFLMISTASPQTIGRYDRYKITYIRAYIVSLSLLFTSASGLASREVGTVMDIRITRNAIGAA